MAPIQRKGRWNQPKNGGSNQQSSSTSSLGSTSYKGESVSLSSGQGEEYPCGVVLSVHPIWPDLGSNQGELFFECTLFLYSVLALFLQYLNLYKSLWWLPKSFWHYSMKLHNINPYFLSCVGLLLGLRVTKCFWSTISYIFHNVGEGKSNKWRQALSLIQYGVVKVPMTTMILTSFFFSFTRIVREFPPSAVIYFFFPPFAYFILFFHEIQQRLRKVWKKTKSVMRKEASPSEIVDVVLEEDAGWIDLDSVAHMCSGVASQVRQEIDILTLDFFLRIKRCIFAGISTAFLSIFLPLAFLPYKTSVGLPHRVLINEMWQIQMAVVVFCTAFTHYVTYLFPLHYLDLMYRSAMHLGRWEAEESSSVATITSSLSKKIPVVVHTIPHPAIMWSPHAAPYAEGTIVEMEGGKRFKAVPTSNKLRTVSAQPENIYHALFSFWCSNPLALINILCLSEFVLIFIQFWLLVLTLEWQHILTLVFLMFANYLLLGKLFKDRVILQRVYDPSKEDLALIQQVQMESLKRKDSNADSR
ncbi:hypothetical protein PENTCL1PPCAC_22941 [Pristionchus entomophagus]|uniref:G protein-coupled receptor n=1 Tax=Pristionchus entomophagus TaxID=358040 RepID=A0AAV5U2N9_9BILA|nr:hypothetical protein PENTCL1PPCAC_22941 [Pristionchus entomophagus]